MRARNIKPGFFMNDDLAEGGPSAQILFAGLWCLADREGKLEDKPKKIKAQVFPYYDPEQFGGKDIEALINFLDQSKFIIRYEVDGSNYIKILKFSDHQRPHTNESISTIPEPLATMVESTCHHGEKLCEPNTQALRSDSLIPDSLIPDSSVLIPKKEKEKNTPPTPRKRGELKISKTFFPENFSISPSVQAWATEHGFTNLPEHLDHFRDWAISNGKQYADWNAVFRNAVRGNWAKINGQAPTKIDYCCNHPTVRARLCMDNQWYCSACLEEIDRRARPSPEDVRRMGEILGNVTKRLSV